MKSIRKFAYAAVFTLSALTLTATSASAQSAHGRFNLTHEVHWQDAVLAAGEYEFSVGDTGPIELLTIRKLTGDRSSYMLMVTDVAQSAPETTDRLVLVPRPAGSFVDRLELAQYGITFRFKVPAERTEMALARTLAAVSSGNASGK